MPLPPNPDPSPEGAPPEAWEPLVRLARIASRPIDRFLRIEAASGILLLITAAIALVWANSRWAESYFGLWHTPVGITLGSFSFERPLEWVVNDGLMVIFFFVVGLEIRREIHNGELSEWRRAALPAAAAVGGMIAPALIYLSIAGAPETRSGWGVPMATDIAFAIGVMALLGRSVPPALRVLLLALAVIDDLGAILVIAIFYSAGISVSGLFTAGLGFLTIRLMARFGVRSKWAYVPPGVVAWAGVYAAGIHPTIAGVIIGLMTPMQAWLGADGFVESVRSQLDAFMNAGSKSLSTHQIAGTVRTVDLASREALSPAESLIETLHPWVAYGIMPLFALANAGVAVSADGLDAGSWHVIGGVVGGLVIGKPLGVFAASWLTLKLGIGRLPAGLRLGHLVVLGMVAGVGFTMALFVSQLAFVDPKLLAAAKIGVLAASGVAAVLGLVMGRVMLTGDHGADAAQTADEAERSTVV